MRRAVAAGIIMLGSLVVSTATKQEISAAAAEQAIINLFCQATAAAGVL